MAGFTSATPAPEARGPLRVISHGGGVRATAMQTPRVQEFRVLEQARWLGALLNRRRAALGRHPVWLTRFNRPLAEAVSEAPAMLPGFYDLEATRDAGACFR